MEEKRSRSAFHISHERKRRDNYLDIIRGGREHVGSSVSAFSARNFLVPSNINFTVSGNQIHTPNVDAHASTTQQNSNLNQTNSQPSNKGRLIPIVIGLIGSVIAARGTGVNFPLGDIIHPKLSILRNAGFQKGRQDFRDQVVSTGIHFRNRFFFVYGGLPGRTLFQQNRLCPPSVNLRDQTQSAFLSSQTTGSEFERRRYQRANPLLPSGVIPDVLDGQLPVENANQNGL